MKPPYRRQRRIFQAAGLVLMALIPVLGIFRIDLAGASLLILGRPIQLSNFAVVAGLAIVLATAPLFTYSTIGTIWCGWACPQNTLSEWANNLTRRLLGSRASVDVQSAGLQVAPSKNKIGNWLQLGLALAAVSLVVGVVPLFYFLAPGDVLSIFDFGAPSQYSRFMHRLYLVSVLAVFIDIAVVRHFWCNYACLYRFGQLLFKTDNALHVVYDASRSETCAKCNYCRTECPTGIDPTAFKFFDRCINCGECIDACNRLQTKRASDVCPGAGAPAPAVLSFRYGRAGGAAGWRGRLRSALGRVGWAGAICVGGCLLLGWGLLQ